MGSIFGETTKKGRKVRWLFGEQSEPFEVAVYGHGAREPGRYDWGNDNPASLLLAFDLLLYATRRVAIATTFAELLRDEVVSKFHSDAFAIHPADVLDWLIGQVAQGLEAVANQERVADARRRKMGDHNAN